MSRRNSIWQEVELALRSEKKVCPAYPDHVCAQAARVAIEAGKLLSEANYIKYNPPTETYSTLSKKALREAAINTAAAAIRFLENMK